MASISVTVRGRVQGVGFRYHVQSVARDLGVVGEVWNCRNGDVEFVAIHESAAVLGEMVARVRNGPGFVADVQAGPGPENLAAKSFEIGVTR